MNAHCCVSLFLGALLVTATTAGSPRERPLLDDGATFTCGDHDPAGCFVACERVGRALQTSDSEFLQNARTDFNDQPWLVALGAFAVAARSATTNPLPDDLPREPGVIDPTLPTIFIAGDSTAARSSGWQQGWAVPFARYLDLTQVNLSNRALGGRSARTYLTQGWWAKLLADVKPGDWVLIQFGHNDASPINDASRARGSLPGVGGETEEIDNQLTQQREVVRTFGSYLREMIRDVHARAATPIVLSTTVRNLWTDGKIERGGPHRTWAREVARAEGVAFVDVTRLVADEYQQLGPERVAAFYPRDHTHLDEAGADFTAQRVIAGLAGLKEMKFTRWLSPAGAAIKPDAIGWLNLPEPHDPARPSLVLIGDSTVRNGRGDGANGEWGWGQVLDLNCRERDHPSGAGQRACACRSAAASEPSDLLTTETASDEKRDRRFNFAKLNLVNRAIGGLSSRTFLTQGHWQRALALIKPGDVVLMQFGHNDSGSLNDTTRARGTLRGIGAETETIDNQLTGERETVGTYGAYLRRYIREAKAAGATPIVCTPVPRKIWRDGRIVRANDSYASWARDVAREEDVPCIDLNELVAARYDELGPTVVNELFADEHTHTSRAGAALTASIVAGELARLKFGHSETLPGGAR